MTNRRSSRFSTTVVSPAPEVRNSQEDNKMPDVEENVLRTPVSSGNSIIGASGITKVRRVKKDCSDVAHFASVSPEEEQESEKGTMKHPHSSKNKDKTVVTPVDEASASVVCSTPRRSVDETVEKTPPKARRTLFHTSNRLVTPSHPSSSSFARKRSGTETTVEAILQPPAKRRLVFGKLVDQIQCNPNVKTIYGIVRKLTGSIGGNGHSGPIYGELTMGSMQKMINLMMTHTNLNSQSRFIDVGSGIGKPNLHVAQYPGVEFSCGVEMEQVRWSLGMTCLQAILNAAATQPANLPDEEAIQCRCIFLHRNIKEARTFDPFTHVYMFSIGKYSHGCVPCGWCVIQESVVVRLKHIFSCCCRCLDWLEKLQAFHLHYGWIFQKCGTVVNPNI
jgi:hypothetical protein